MYDPPVNKTQNLTHLMHNLNLMSQKQPFDSINSTSNTEAVRRSQQVHPSTTTHKDSRPLSGHAGQSKPQKTIENRYPVTSQLVMDREALARTLDHDHNSKVPNKEIQINQQRKSFYETQPLTSVLNNQTVRTPQGVSVQLSSHLRSSHNNAGSGKKDTMITIQPSSTSHYKERSSSIQNKD